VYSYESGALNEALSDIFGAMVDRQEGATGADIWKIGEDIYTPNTPGDSLRDMSDPAAAGDYDWWPTRYTGDSDNGGVHSNSGIANLAFYMLSQGGMHPQGKSSVSVSGIGMDAAAQIFYQANVNCLTSGSNFAAARYCTADVFGGSNAANVHAAWDAVGVPNDPPPPPPAPIELSSGVSSTINSMSTGVTQRYTMEVGKVAVDETVTCTTTCNNGDADLYLRFGQEPELNPNSSVNACGSYSTNSNESCTTGKAPASTTFYASVQAYTAFTNLQINCVVNPVGSCKPVGDSCNSSADCCSGNCKGRFQTCK
jgi:vibriolysin